MLNVFVLCAQDPYFPHGVIDLRYTISCEIVDPKSFRLRTSQKSVRLGTDSTTNRDEWIKAIRKVVFKAQNQGDSVKVRTSEMMFGFLLSCTDRNSVLRCDGHREILCLRF